MLLISMLHFTHQWVYQILWGLTVLEHVTLLYPVAGSTTEPTELIVLGQCLLSVM